MIAALKSYYCRSGTGGNGDGVARAARVINASAADVQGKNCQSLMMYRWSTV